MIRIAERMTREDMAILHLYRYVNVDRNGYSMPKAINQDGIAEALGISRGHASIVLRALESKGLVEHGYAHSGGGCRRRVYFLLPAAIMAVPEIRRKAEAVGTSDDRSEGTSDVSPGMRMAESELGRAVESMKRNMDGEVEGKDVLR